MKSSQVAKIYARSLFSLGIEEKINVTDDAHRVQDLILSCNDLENLLYLEIFTALEKRNVLESIFLKIQISKLMQNFLLFLVEEKRIRFFPAIFQELMLLDDMEHGIIRGVIEGSQDTLADNDRDKISAYLMKKIGRKPELSYQKSQNVLAGVRVYAEDLQFDASIDYQLEQFKQSLLGE